MNLNAKVWTEAQRLWFLNQRPAFDCYKDHGCCSLYEEGPCYLEINEVQNSKPKDADTEKSPPPPIPHECGECGECFDWRKFTVEGKPLEVLIKCLPREFEYTQTPYQIQHCTTYGPPEMVKMTVQLLESGIMCPKCNAYNKIVSNHFGIEW